MRLSGRRHLFEKRNALATLLSGLAVVVAAAPSAASTGTREEDEPSYDIVVLNPCHLGSNPCGAGGACRPGIGNGWSCSCSNGWVSNRRHESQVRSTSMHALRRRQRAAKRRTATHASTSPRPP